MWVLSVWLCIMYMFNYTGYLADRAAGYQWWNCVGTCTTEQPEDPFGD